MRIGFSGHQYRENLDWAWVRQAIERELESLTSTFVGLSCLAAGSDQIFADAVMKKNANFVAVIPMSNYEKFFSEPRYLAEYKRLLPLATKRIFLQRDNIPAENAFLLAGQYIVENSDALLVVWDGHATRGLGGTADVVDYARKRKRPICHINPELRQTHGDPKWPLRSS